MKRLTVTPDGKQTVRKLTAKEIGQKQAAADRDRQLNEPNRKRARLSTLRRELTDAQLAGETPDPAKVSEFRALRAELGL